MCMCVCRKELEGKGGIGSDSPDLGGGSEFKDKKAWKLKR